MPNFSLQLKGDFQNVTGLVPADGVETELLVQLECTSCHELHPRAVALLPSNVNTHTRSDPVTNPAPAESHSTHQ